MPLYDVFGDYQIGDLFCHIIQREASSLLFFSLTGNARALIAKRAISKVLTLFLSQ